MAKILHISKYYYPYYGGIEDVAQTIVRELTPYHRQKVICFSQTKESSVDIVEGVEVTRVGVVGKFFSQPIPIEYYKKLKKLILDFQPEYIHIHLPNPIVAMFLLLIRLDKTKIVVHWHADITEQKLLYKTYKKYERKLLFRADKIIATSDVYAKHSEPLKYFAYKTVVVPNTVNENKFISRPNEKDRIESLKNRYGNKKILLFLGRHVPYKGIEYLIESEKYIGSDCVILIGGKGRLTPKLKEFASRTDRIVFVGRISDDDLPIYLKAASLFVFPSVNRSEAFGVALAEALYCGTPAVSFDIEGSGVNWVNRDGYSGIVVENRNAKAFAEAIDSLLCDGKKLIEFGNNAIAHIQEHFVVSKAFDVLRQLYETKTYDKLKVLANVSIVLYNNYFSEVRDIVATLKKSSRINRIFLIDNSIKPNAEYEALDVSYVFNTQNVGYGRGHNIALRQTIYDQSAQYHFVLNADIAMEDAVVDKIVAYMDRHKDVGALMPKVYYPNRSVQYLCRLLPSPFDLFGRRFLPKWFMKKRIERLEMRSSSYNQTIEVPHISGCCMCIRIDVLCRVGLFDERYFLYLEDIDLTRRISMEAKTLFFPEVSIIHEHRRGSYNDMKLLCMHIVSAVKYFNKWGWIIDKLRRSSNRHTINQVIE
ncbi:MAG: hypothetical protein CSA89_00415 [Bacteroidales bacterium]|nr:MAG: hypothetical protein CSA89_00415 [Bacteroidales bacterium]